MSNIDLETAYQQLGFIRAETSVLNGRAESPLVRRLGARPMNIQDKHTSKSFDQDLEAATGLFLAMGEAVAVQVAKSIHALTDVDEILAQEVIKVDNDINHMEIELDERILLLVAKRQPAASDLRLVMAISKGVVDLERIGDEAVKIAQMANQITVQGNSPRGYSEVQHLGNQVRLMVHNSLEAFSNLNAEQAFDVMRNDGVINREYQSAIRSLMTYIMEDSRYVSNVINIMWVLRALERIGDHARNIAELVIYSVSGKDVRHTDFAQVEKAVQEVNEQQAIREANKADSELVNQDKNQSEDAADTNTNKPSNKK